MTTYECDKCGACCNGHFLIEVYDIDVIREPRLLDVDPHYSDLSYHQALQVLSDDGRCVTIVGRCSFLDTDNRCSIYNTRPNDCVAMQPGDEQCQLARKAEGLPPLEPVSV